MILPGPKLSQLEMVAYAICLLVVAGVAAVLLRANPVSKRVPAATMAPVSPADGRTQESDSEDEARLRTRIASVLRDTSTAAAGVALIRRDGTDWIAGIGLADVEAGVSATGDTLFRLGSTSKIFVALAALKLESEGRLSLNDTLRSRAPDLSNENRWEETDPVRLVHLLEHTAGWDDLPLKAFAHRPEVEQPLGAFFPLWAPARTSRWRPGTVFFYSNAGTSAAAYIVETVAGEPFESYVQRGLFDPLEMKTVSYFETPETQRRLARPYHTDGRTPFPYWRLVTRPAGAVNASPREMANLLRLFIQRGEFAGRRLISEAALARMETATTTSAARAGLKMGYGLCLYSDLKDGREYFAHAGGVIGGLADFVYHPDLKTGYVIMLNGTNGKAFGKIGALIRAHLTKDVAPAAPPPVASVPASVAAEFRGWYEKKTLRRDNAVLRPLTLGRVELTGSEMQWRSLGRKQRLLAVTAQTFRPENSPIATAALVESDGERLVQFSPIPGMTFRRVSALQAWVQIITLVLAGVLGLSTCFHALLWLPGRLMGGLRGPGQLSMRALPLLTVLSLGALIAIFQMLSGRLEALLYLGRPSPWSYSIFLLTLSFPVLAVAALVQALRFSPREIKPAVWWHSFAMAFVMVVIATYMARSGVFALRMWT